MPEEKTFDEGYLAGWRSLRDPADVPVNIPASPVTVPTTAFMVGMARGIRDAAGMGGLRYPAERCAGIPGWGRSVVPDPGKSRIGHPEIE
jgi:hypothetical protein